MTFTKTCIILLTTFSLFQLIAQELTPDSQCVNNPGSGSSLRISANSKRNQSGEWVDTITARSEFSNSSDSVGLDVTHNFFECDGKRVIYIQGVTKDGPKNTSVERIIVVDVPKNTSVEQSIVVDGPKNTSVERLIVVDGPKNTSVERLIVVDVPKNTSVERLIVVDVPKNTSVERLIVVDVPKNTSVERLTFHPRHGANIEILNNGRTIQKTNNDDQFNSVVFTNLPLKNDEIFQIRLDRKGTKFSSSLGLGIMTSTPTEVEIPAHAFNSPFTWMYYNDDIYSNNNEIKPNYGRSLNVLKVGHRVGVMRKQSGDLHFFINGVDQGLAVSGIPPSVYGVVELRANAQKATIIDK